MWYKTKAAQLLGITYPILQGPFGGSLSTVALTATVSNAGGLGGYGAYTLTPQEIVEVGGQIRAATDQPFNINLWVSDTDGDLTDAQFEETSRLFKPYFDELSIPLPSKPAPFQSRFENQIDAILHLKPKVFSFMFGVPSADILEQCRKQGILLVGAATTLDEAIVLEAAGVDLLIASGFEAGGHRPSFLASAEQSITGTFVLIQQLRDRVKTPVIAAGGIATGKGVAAALALGASAAQIGTAFLACEESGATAMHREMLFSDAAKYTSLTRAFTGRLGRGITSRISKEKLHLPFPLQTHFMASLRKAAIEQEKRDMIMFWGGQIAPVLKHRKAAELMKAIVGETTEYYDGLRSL